MDHAYDPVPGEPPVCPVPDYELGTPYSWFEYETDNRLHEIMVSDQVRKLIFIFSNLFQNQKDLVQCLKILIAVRTIGDLNQIKKKKMK